MTGIVRIALRRPYTFVVMAVLILLFGISAALRTPIDIFPNINIPVVAVVFSYTGLPPDDMSGRVVTLTIQNLITPVGTQKIGKFEYTVNLNGSPSAIVAFNNLPIKTVNGTVVYMRDVAHIHDGSPPQTTSSRLTAKMPCCCRWSRRAQPRPCRSFPASSSCSQASPTPCHPA
jgi:multidrug efflux pump subunit AcrB